jgi:pimeloyl-ACP methyl ester carboxylesterase
MGCERFDLLGFGSGANIAAELNQQSPSRFGRLALVQPWLLDDAERPIFSNHYAPDLAPRWDGTHLLSAWQMLRDQALFWPWFRRQADAIRSDDPSVEIDPEFLQRRLVALMNCLDSYHATLVSALAHPLLERLHGIDQPVLMAGQSSHPLTRRLISPDVMLPADRRAWGGLLDTALGAAD